jgi:hypothetical protein
LFEHFLGPLYMMTLISEEADTSTSRHNTTAISMIRRRP